MFHLQKRTWLWLALPSTPLRRGLGAMRHAQMLQAPSPGRPMELHLLPSTSSKTGVWERFVNQPPIH